MPTISIEAELSSDKLLEAVSQLSPLELEKFASQILALRAQYRAPNLSQSEAELLLKINQGVPPTIQKRYDELVAKRRAETLTPEEYDELLGLTEQVEKFETRRIEDLTELARLRKTSLTALMDDLGIRPPAYV